MKLLHVLLTRNLLNASRWHVTSISTMTTPYRDTGDSESPLFEYRVTWPPRELVLRGFPTQDRSHVIQIGYCGHYPRTATPSLHSQKAILRQRRASGS